MFATSIYTLLQEKISEAEITSTHDKLERFVRKYQLFYGKTKMTMNVHCLLHLIECVGNLGPLWTFSMFCFESFNGTLKKYCEDLNNVVNQVLERLIIETTTHDKCVEVPSEILSLERKIIVCLPNIEKVALCEANIVGRSTFFASRKLSIFSFIQIKTNTV